MVITRLVRVGQCGLDLAMALFFSGANSNKLGKVSYTEISEIYQSGPPVLMPRVQPDPPEPARQTIAPKPKPPTEPSAVKRQPIGDLAMGVVSPAEVRPSKDDLGNQATTWPTPPPSPPANDVTQQFTLPKPPIPASKLGNELEITAQEMQDTPAPDKGADNPPPPAKSKLGQDL